MTKISIIGAGRIGTNTALELVRANFADITLLDRSDERAKGEARDLLECSPAFDYKYTVQGTSDYADIADSDLVLITAGAPRTAGMSRLDLLESNSKIITEIGGNLAKHTPDAIILCVTNPTDYTTNRLYKITKFPQERIIGSGSLLDSFRFRVAISEELKVPISAVEAMVIGEHGDSMVPLVSQTKVSGAPLETKMNAGQIEKVIAKARMGGASVIKLKGSTQHAPSTSISLTAETIILDRQTVIPTSVYLQGEYGISDICLGVPTKLGKNGAEIVELDLSENELKDLQSSAEIVRKSVNNFS